MAWANSALSNGSYVTSKDVTKAQIGMVRVDYDSPAGSWPEYHLHYNQIFFGTTTRTVTEYVGLSSAGADAVMAAHPSQSVYKVSVKGMAELLFEKSSVVASKRRVDASGQYHVTVVETSTVTDGTEHDL